MDQERSVEGSLVSEHHDTEKAEDDGGARTPEEVRAEIEQTREELGDTVEALAAKTDVKGQAKQAVSDARSSVNEKVAGVRESVTGTAADLSSSAQQATPGSVSDAGSRASRLVRENRPASLAIGAFALGILLGRRRSR